MEPGEERLYRLPEEGFLFEFSVLLNLSCDDFLCGFSCLLELFEGFGEKAASSICAPELLGSNFLREEKFGFCLDEGGSRSKFLLLGDLSSFD